MTPEQKRHLERADEAIDDADDLRDEIETWKQRYADFVGNVKMNAQKCAILYLLCEEAEKELRGGK